jgi:hypothetical protein
LEATLHRTENVPGFQSPLIGSASQTGFQFLHLPVLGMMGNFERRRLIFGLLAVTILVMARAQTLLVQNLHLSLDEPVYTSLPVWIKTDLAYPYEARYPYSEDPSDFGPNEIELKRRNEAMQPRSFPRFGNSPGSGIQDGSVAPPNAPENRLPLHLKYPIDEPGTYSVRWTAVRHVLVGKRQTKVVVGRSDWLTFEVKPSTPEQRDAWLEKTLAAVPTDPGPLVGDFLPSLLVASPDPRVLRRVLDLLYSKDQLVSGYAFDSLGLFHADELRAQALELTHHRGLSDRMAYLLSWHPQFQDRREELVQATLPYLQSSDDRQVAATLQLLGWVVHPPKVSWPASSDIPGRADRAVLAAAPSLLKRDGDIPQMLALYLGGVKSDESRGLLWQLVEGAGSGHEQALIVLTWIGDDRDLPRLGEWLWRPGDADIYGRDLSTLPYGLMHGYGDRAIPYLEQAISASPYVFVRTESAEQLILKQKPAAIGFFLDAVQNHRFYKQELIQWLIDQCGLPPNSDDQAVIAFLKSRTP